MELKNFFAQDAQGNVIPSPQAFLYLPGTTTLATGLQNADGGELTNPFTGNVRGQLQFAAPAGDYDLRLVGAGRDFTMRVRFLQQLLQFPASPLAMPISTAVQAEFDRLWAAIGKLTSGAPAPSPTPSPTVTISAAQSKQEGNSGAVVYTYTVTRSNTSGATSVPWSFQAGTTSADDYTGGALPAGGSVALAAGVASGTIAISVNGDAVVEGNETFTVLISTPAGYVAGAATSATGTILNDDVAVTPTPSPSPTPTPTAFRFATAQPAGAEVDSPYVFQPTVEGAGTKVFTFSGAVSPESLGGTFDTVTGAPRGPFTSAGTITGKIAVSGDLTGAELPVSIPVAASPGVVPSLRMALVPSEQQTRNRPLGPMTQLASAFGGTITAQQADVKLAPVVGLRRVNRVSALSMNGNQSLSVSLAHTAGHTLILAIVMDTRGVARFLFAGPTGGLGVRLSATGQVQVLRQGQGTLLNSSINLVPGKLHILTIKAGPWGASIRVDGADAGSVAVDAALTQPITSIGGLTSAFIGALAAAFEAPGDMPLSDVATIEGYITSKLVNAPPADNSQYIASGDGNVFKYGDGQPMAWAA
jgi:hypothetical protein